MSIFSIAAAAATYKVKPGDTLWHLAKKHHTTPKAIAKA
ncbi:MAG: LysM peptidoglycan-binding domain-containing protein, partial [Armatimonadetes bacterium]|nr:LysM peptidoglycan-binding domain-containing protein [Armatimonadota bacterium]